METTTKPTNLTLEEDPKESTALRDQVGPGRIGIYDRPDETGSSAWVALFIGFIVLIITVVTIYIQFFMV